MTSSSCRPWRRPSVDPSGKGGKADSITDHAGSAAAAAAASSSAAPPPRIGAEPPVAGGGGQPSELGVLTPPAQLPHAQVGIV